MTDRARIRIAAAVTALFLAGVSAAGLASRDHRPRAVTPATAPAVTAPARAAAPGVATAGEPRGDDDWERHEESDEDD
jgi:hypothetical protein